MNKQVFALNSSHSPLSINFWLMFLDMFKKSSCLWHFKNWKITNFCFIWKWNLVFAHKCFKSCYGYCIIFSVKIWSNEAQGYASNILLLLYQYAFIDKFFRKNVIEIWEINLWRTNSSIKGSREKHLQKLSDAFITLEQK